MGLIYKWVEGEKQAKEYLAKVGKCKLEDVRRCENIMRLTPTLWAELHEQLGVDGYYHDTWLLIMYDQSKETTCDIDKIRRQAYEDVRTGKITF